MHDPQARQAAIELFREDAPPRGRAGIQRSPGPGRGFAGRRRAGAGATGTVADTPADTPAESLPASLVQGADGLFDWRFGAMPPAVAAAPAGLAGRRSGGVFATEVPIDTKQLEVVQGSMVSRFLAERDKGFNDRYGLYTPAGEQVDRIVERGRVLLIVHGTFSNCGAILAQFDRCDAGEGRSAGAFLAGLAPRYDQVLCFEHPTLQVGPWLNALDLARAFAGKDVQVDVVCHSRGGLVARWWLEVFSRQLLANARVVFVGAPLMGTGLASPYRVRTAMKLFTNYAVAVKQMAGLAAVALPMFRFAEMAAGLVGSALTVAAKAPLADTVVAAIPGLAAMARYGVDGAQFIDGNVELAKLGFGCDTPPAGYFAVQSNFEPEAVGWQFWRAFRDPLLRVADAGTDALFSGRNDLVVDTASMTCLSPQASLAAADRILDFGTSQVVHHVNYFEQAQTLRFIAQALAR